MEHSNGTNGTNGNIPEKPKYIDFPCLKPGARVDGRHTLNRWSSTITKGEIFKLNGERTANEPAIRP